MQREIKLQVIHRGIVNLPKMLKISENFYALMELKSGQESDSLCSFKVSSPLENYFSSGLKSLRDKATVVTPQILPHLEMSKG